MRAASGLGAAGQSSPCVELFAGASLPSGRAAHQCLGKRGACSGCHWLCALGQGGPGTAGLRGGRVSAVASGRECRVPAMLFEAGLGQSPCRAPAAKEMFVRRLDASKICESHSDLGKLPACAHNARFQAGWSLRGQPAAVIKRPKTQRCRQKVRLVAPVGRRPQGISFRVLRRPRAQD